MPELFNQQRLPDVHALNQLDRKAYSFFRRKGLLDPDFLQLLSHIVIGTLLSKLVPFLYGPKVKLLQLGTTTPYAEIMAAINRDSKIGLGMVVVLGLAVAAKLSGLL